MKKMIMKTYNRYRRHKTDIHITDADIDNSNNNIDDTVDNNHMKDYNESDNILRQKSRSEFSTTTVVLQFIKLLIFESHAPDLQC